MSKHPHDKRLFHFRQFSLHHHQSSMKVGTDAVLLGAWADIGGADSILDVGTGCGIISLLLAARSRAKVDALEIDPASVQECTENFRSSVFGQQLHVEQIGFSEYASSCRHRYDLIVSNPPFFKDYSFKPKEEARKNARHADTLSFGQLCEGVARLLKPDAKFCLVLPMPELPGFMETAAQFQLHVQKQMDIFPRRNQAANRVNLQLGFNKPKEIQTENFTIRENDLTFTNQYTDFLKDYYIGLD
ncbi:MAG: methyltransferase [Bacteroidales bacterium]|nr:methyltransferase [Bacteroidales bacterium]MCF6342725.1 methyltransferase [Bacteroidales bacterium]